MNGSPFDLRWRLFGIRFCIQPSFWLMNALWGYLLSEGLGDNRGRLMFVVVWILCTLVSVMVHELGHVLMGKLFGQPGNITLGGLGGQAMGNFEALTPLKRIFVAFAGPGAGFLFLAVLIVLDGDGWNLCMDWLNLDFLKVRMHLLRTIAPSLRENAIYQLVMLLLFVMNLFWNIINLLPIIPMDGGMIFREVCCIISPQGGMKFAYAISFLLASIITIYHILVILQDFQVVRFPFHLWSFRFPIITLIMFGMMAFQSFMALRQVTMMQKHSMYARRDDEEDDISRPRGVKEVPVKDPRDFAPPAPGSERPRQ